MPLAMQIWSAANEYITKIYSIKEGANKSLI